MSDLIKLTIDGHDVEVPRGSTIMDATKKLAIEVPHFCYHERLSVAGNCRMCLVEVEGAPKPVASCHWPVNDGMVVNTKSETTKEARKGVMEFLLINHPLDCPICDQAGECDLQDVAVSYGSDRSRYEEMKRAVDDHEIGAKIKTVMTRCIHCTRCIRFATEVAGVEEFGATGRGENMSVGTYVERALESELAGNMIDLCPVGALTNKPYAFTARPWELEHADSIDVNDAVGSHISVDHRAGQVLRIKPRECDEINEEWIPDTTRFSWDGLSNDRLTAPVVNGRASNWNKAFEAIKASLKGKKKDKIAGLAGNVHCAEDLYAFNAFMKETLGSESVDSRTDGFGANGKNRSAYTMGTAISDIEKADVVLLVGCDPRYEAPIINLRLRKASAKGAAVFNIGAEVDLRYPTTELGDTVDVLDQILAGKTPAAKALKSAKNPVIILGGTALSRGDAQAVLKTAADIADKYDVVTDDWNGFNVLVRQSGRVAALDLGVVPTGKGLSAKAIRDVVQGKKMDVLVIYGEGDIPVEDLKGAKFTIYIGTHKSAYAKMADVALPAATFAEKSGLWTNAEGVVQLADQAVQPPLQAKEDWKIFRALSEQIGEALPFDTQTQLRHQIAEAHPAYGMIGDVLQTPWAPPGKAGKLLKAKLERPVTAFYQTNEVLRASKVMADCQAEKDTFDANKNMKKAG